MNNEPVPFFVPDLGEAEIEEVVATLRSGWLTTGPKVRQFETEFASAVGAKHAVAVNSATAALHLSLEAAGVGEGDEVLVPTMTFAATAEVVIHLGARPVLVDCLPDTLNIDPAQAAAAVTPRTKAIMPMHYGGQPCAMRAIVELAQAHELAVVEDAAHALPARYEGRTVGSIGDATCFSFYANKTITTGEGGMLTTDREEIAERARMMSLHGLSRDAWKRYSAAGGWYYEIEAAGYKYNMTDIAAALGIHQLRRAEDFRERRARCAAWYDQQLADVAEIALPAVADGVEHAWHLYVIHLHLDRLSIDRDAFIGRLTEEKIGSSVHWMPLHMHPLYRRRYGYAPDDLPVAAAAFTRVISLPIFPSMSRQQVDRVAEVVRDIVGESRR